jgi:Fe-S cluster assembly iron-binding protein IscA
MPPLIITEPALERLADAIRNLNGSRSEDACFRLTVDEEGNLALALDVTSPDDKTFQHKKVTVLVVSKVLAEGFAGRALDVNAAGDFVLA